MSVSFLGFAFPSVAIACTAVLFLLQWVLGFCM